VYLNGTLEPLSAAHSPVECFAQNCFLSNHFFPTSRQAGWRGEERRAQSARSGLGESSKCGEMRGENRGWEEEERGPF